MKEGEGKRQEKVALDKLAIFQGLTLDEAEAFVETMGGRVQRFLKKTSLVYRHDEKHYVGVVVKGAVQIVLTDIGDHEVLAYELHKDALFGNVWALVPETYCGLTVVVRPKSTLLWLPYGRFLTESPPPPKDERKEHVYGIVRQNIFMILTRLMFVMIQKIEVLSQHTLRSRLCLYLMQQARMQKTEQVRLPGRVELAKMLGCNRSALTREIGRMEDEGVLVCGQDWMRLKKKPSNE